MRRLFVLTLTFLVVLLSGCSSTASSSGQTEERPFPEIEASYVEYSYEEILEQSDYIVAGYVASISDTSWNQDSGEYWEETTQEGEFSTLHTAWPVYQIEIVVENVISSNTKVEETLVLTTLGRSPNQDVANSETDQSVSALATDRLSHLQVGDEIVGFLINGEIAWRDPLRPIQSITDSEGTTSFDIGRRNVITFIGNPADSYLIKKNDGIYRSPEGSSLDIAVSLDELNSQIQDVKNINK